MRRTISPKCLKEFAQLADQCLHSRPKRRPTMAQVVLGLEYVLALQEKANNALKPARRTIFGNKVPMFVSPSNGESSDGDIRLKSLRYHLDTIHGENHDFRLFDFDTIRVATENFSKSNYILQFRFNFMYKGRLQNGQDIAIAETFSNKFVENHMHEASLLMKCEHKNLVKLLGYCIEGTKVFLIYELVSNTSLYHLIYDPKMCTNLDWNKLYTIILGVASVLAYLHKHAPIRIIHGNVGPRNILLDENFNPKLSDFRFATAINETDCFHVEVIRSTLGYGAPEYFQKGVLSTKADVYNFGVLVLRTLTGRKTSAYSPLVEYLIFHSDCVENASNRDKSIQMVLVPLLIMKHACQPHVTIQGIDHVLMYYLYIMIFKKKNLDVMSSSRGKHFEQMCRVRLRSSDREVIQFLPSPFRKCELSQAHSRSRCNI
ncbi:hypothetical protein E3N88_40958 [Mikania micrantha]|uniref:non-specific serine/threonine protein kinase n=1 Tax=Mikania micrantha TaxID=192012 RepID=A0A5N6LQ22_9ASTR|nr:hypothetical protein E3N88_40958 [Mikania micrantha]